MEFKNYRKTGVQLMRPYVPGEDMTGISISEADKALPTLEGGMIAVNPRNEEDKWYVAKDFFEANYELEKEHSCCKGSKTLDNTTANQAKDQVSDIKFWGNGDLWKLISKASSKNEGWMKSTKAMEISNYGCLIQVSTQQGENVAEAITFIPGVTIKETKDGDIVVAREIIPFV